jgi:chorismate mutase
MGNVDHPMNVARMLLICLVVMVAPSRLTASVSERLDPLVMLMVQRLQLSREVAWTKCRLGIPVADPAREARMLTDLKTEGSTLGLTATEVTRLFLPQIAASRRYQEELIAGWRTGIDLPKIKPLDIATEIRPRLDRVNHEMLRQWKLVCRAPLDWADREEAERTILAHGIPAEIAKIAARPLGKR